MAKKHINEVLFVDDSDDEAFVTELLLKSVRLDIAIHHCSDYSMLETYLLSRPDAGPTLAVVDLNMPILNGTDVLKKIYSKFDKTQVYAGIFSGSEDPKDREDATNSGALFFLKKPMDFSFFTELCKELPEFSIDECDNGEMKLFVEL